MFYEQGWHPRFMHADADAVTRHARLRYFKFGTPDAVSIADAHLAVKKSLDVKFSPNWPKVKSLRPKRRSQ